MEFLLEIKTEEMPRDHVEAALAQLADGLTTGLNTHGLLERGKSSGAVATFGTCRRLILLAETAPRQLDGEEVLVGPPRGAAVKPDGTFGPAALGFARSRGVEVDNLEVVATEKGEYIGIRKVIKGKSAQAVLSEIVPQLIERLTFPKMMRWGGNPFRFSRPLKGILCVMDGKTLSFSVGGVESGDITTGHRLFAPEAFKVDSFRQYREELRRRRVIISRDSRKSRILMQIAKRLEPLEAQHYSDEDLLEKLAMDVEYPYVFMGTFPEPYLKLPLDVLSTAMREGQNLFSVVKGRKQLPVFIGVSDGCSDARGLVRKGNERVLKARLEDARFFWENDLRTPLKERCEDLSRIIFQEQLGSYADKSARIKKISTYMAGKADAGDQRRAIATAAELCKADLLTDMVREFPSLQGKAGGLYARKEGQPAAVWKSVYEHYQPVHLGDGVPSTLGGAILSISDKLDSIVGVMGLGVEISGSKDPFGLRRNAQGVCSVILDRKISFSFPRLLDKVIATYDDNLEVDRVLLRRRCLDFFRGRLEFLFEKRGFRYDLINAVLALGIDDIYHAHLRLKALEALKTSTQFLSLIQIAKRVNNILRDQPPSRLNPDLFTEKEERELYTSFTIIRDNVAPLISRGDFNRSQRIILRIRSSIHTFFDKVLVMSEDKAVRRNRLALLQEISKLLSRIADYSQVVTGGENG